MQVFKVYLDRYKKSIKNMGFYFLASLIPMFISLLLSPVFAIYLSPKDYAIIGYYSSFGTLFSPLVLFYMNQYYMREYFYCNDNERIVLRAMLYKFFVIVPFIILVFCLIGLFVYMTYFNQDSDIPYWPYAILALLPTAFVGLFRLELIDCKVQRKAKSYFVLSMFSCLIIALISVLLVVVFKLGALGRLIGLLSAPLVLFAWSFYRHRELIKISFPSTKLMAALKFCFPLVLAAMLEFFSRGYDKVALEKVVSVEQLGYYSIGVTIAGYLSVFSTAIGDTFSPDIFESLASHNFKRMLKYSAIQMGIMAIIVLIFVICAKPLIWIFTAGRYVESAPYAKIAAIATLSSIMYCIIGNIVQSYKKTNVFLFTKIVGSCCCALTYSLLIKQFTLIGAAWGMVLSGIYFSVFAIIFLKISLRLDKK